jgi:phospholipid-translocating ATPase
MLHIVLRMLRHTAIGHTTNLIGRESNIIIIKGGNENGRPVREQLLAAFDEFFDGDGFDLPAEQQISGRPTSLRRVNTGVSSIVGSDNGNRPGGFVLVVDGAALTQVSFSVQIIWEGPF